MACANEKHQTCNVIKLSTSQPSNQRSFGEANQDHQSSTGSSTKQTKVKSIQVPNSESFELEPLGPDLHAKSREPVEGKTPTDSEPTDILEEGFDETFSNGWPYPIPQDYFDGAFLTLKLQKALSPADTKITLTYAIKADPEFHLSVGVAGVSSKEEAEKHCPILGEKWIKVDILDRVPSISRESGSPQNVSEEMSKLTSPQEQKKEVRVEVPVSSGMLSAPKKVDDTSPNSSPLSTVMTIKRRASQTSDLSSPTSIPSPGAEAVTPTSVVSPSANSTESPSATSTLTTSTLTTPTVSPLAASAVSHTSSALPPSATSPSTTSSSTTPEKPSETAPGSVVHSPGTHIGAEAKENEVATTLVVQYPGGVNLGTIGGYFRGSKGEIRCTSAYHCVEKAEHHDCIARHGTHTDATIRYIRGQIGLTNDTALFRVSGPNWTPSGERPDRLSTYDIIFPDRAKYTKILRHMANKMLNKQCPIVVKFGRSTGTTAGHIVSLLHEAAYLTARLPTEQGDSGALAFVLFGNQYFVVGQHIGVQPADYVKSSPASSPDSSPVSAVSTISTVSSAISSTVSSPVSNASKSTAPAGSDAHANAGPKVALIEMVYQQRSAQSWGDLLVGFDWGGFFLTPTNEK